MRCAAWHSSVGATLIWAGKRLLGCSLSAGGQIIAPATAMVTVRIVRMRTWVVVCYGSASSRACIETASRAEHMQQSALSWLLCTP